jgi:acetyl esterase/lipase
MSWLLFVVATALVLLSVWIVVPAPAIWAVALSIGTSELSPLFLIAALVTGGLAWRFGGSMRIATITLSMIATGLCLLPIVRYPREAPFSFSRLVRGLEPGDANVHRGVTVNAASSLTMDVYQPASGDRHPILVQIYGGAWQRGAPGDDAPFARYFAAHGYAVFAIDYRHAPEAKWPAQIDDVRAAITWVRAHAADYHADAGRIAIIGRSAGAQLAMLAGFTDPAIKGVISYYGPVNLTRGWREPPSPDPIGSRPVLEAYLGGTPDQVPADYKDASPIEHISATVPPTLLIYGSRDHIVQAMYGRDLYAHLIAAGAKSELVEIPWADHAFDAIAGGLSGQLSLWHTERFLQRVLPIAGA